jgi:hypothetical protein
MFDHDKNGRLEKKEYREMGSHMFNLKAPEQTEDREEEQPAE